MRNIIATFESDEFIVIIHDDSKPGVPKWLSNGSYEIRVLRVDNVLAPFGKYELEKLAPLLQEANDFFKSRKMKINDTQDEEPSSERGD